MIVFAAYLVLLVYLLLFSGGFGRQESLQEGTGYNLVPFREICRYVKYWRQIGTGSVILNVIGNVIGFVPFGMLVPALFPVFRKAWRVILLGLFVSVTVETLQLLFHVGIFDVDDLILNTLGTAAGYGISVLLRRLAKGRNGGRKPDEK